VPVYLQLPIPADDDGGGGRRLLALSRLLKEVGCTRDVFVHLSRATTFIMPTLRGANVHGGASQVEGTQRVKIARSIGGRKTVWQSRVRP